jgi:hypothetical protein
MDPFGEFRQDSGIVYPPFSQVYFEKYFYNYITTKYSSNLALLERYIPIFWTENQISPFDRSSQERRQMLVDSLNKDIQHFAIVQHDDGVTHTRLQNTIVFGMGGVGHIPLPLTYENPELFAKFKNTPKTIFCSFMGSLTHPCRMASCRQLHNKPGIVLNVHGWTNQIPEANQQKFIEIMSKSRFTLAPRGYGKSSFRMYEALNLQSIPVYVYDQPWLPYTEILDWKKMAVLIHVNDIPNMYETLQKITDQEVSDMLAYYEKHKNLFTYDGMCEYVINKIKA